MILKTVKYLHICWDQDLMSVTTFYYSNPDVKNKHCLSLFQY